MVKHKKIVIIDRKLGRERVEKKPVWAIFHADEGIIEIDPRQTERKYANSAIHEILHWHFPEISETRIIKASGAITKQLYLKGYRRVMDQK